MGLGTPKISIAILNPPCYPFALAVRKLKVMYVYLPHTLHSSGSFDDPRLFVFFTIICFKSFLELGGV